MPNYRSTKDWELKGVNPSAPWTLIASGTLPNPEDTKPQSVDDETRHPLVVYQAHTPTMAQVKCLGVKHTQMTSATDSAFVTFFPFVWNSLTTSSLVHFLPMRTRVL